MQIESNEQSVNDKIDILQENIEEYYQEKNIDIKLIDFSHSDWEESDIKDIYYVDFLVNKKHVIRYSIRTSPELFATIWLGIGPHFIHPSLLMSEEEANKFNSDTTTEAVMENLKLMDECILKREQL